VGSNKLRERHKLNKENGKDMAAAKKQAAKKSDPGTAMVAWQERFAKEAKEGVKQLATLGAVGASVKFGRGSISVGGVTVAGGKLECVILGNCALNALYLTEYDADNPTSPDCYGFALTPLGRNNEDMNDPPFRPHELVKDKQSDTCASCEHKQWGTAKRGKGKLCGGNVRLALVVAKDVLDDADEVAAAEIAVGKVSTTNQDAWGEYVKMVADIHGRPIWAVVTEISSYDDPKTQIRLEFKLADLINDPIVLEALSKRATPKVQEILQTPFPVFNEDEAVKKSVKKPAAKNTSKFAGKARR
jgi:hypothetical protein